MYNNGNFFRKYIFYSVILSSKMSKICQKAAKWLEKLSKLVWFYEKIPPFEIFFCMLLPYAIFLCSKWLVKWISSLLCDIPPYAIPPCAISTVLYYFSFLHILFLKNCHFICQIISILAHFQINNTKRAKKGLRRQKNQPFLHISKEKWPFLHKNWNFFTFLGIFSLKTHKQGIFLSPPPAAVFSYLL